MTPEIEAILNRVGWAKVKASYPATAIAMRRAISEAPNFRTVAERKEAQAHVRRLWRGLSQAAEAIDALSGEDRGTANHWAAIALNEDVYNGAPDRITGLLQAMHDIAPGLVALAEDLGPGVSPRKRGRPPNEAAQSIARALADVFLFGVGARPTYGRDGATGEATGAFCQALADLLLSAGLHVSDVADLAETTVKGLAPDRVVALQQENRDWRQRAWAYGPSLFDVPYME